MENLGTRGISEYFFTAERSRMRQENRVFTSLHASRAASDVTSKVTLLDESVAEPKLGLKCDLNLVGALLSTFVAIVSWTAYGEMAQAIQTKFGFRKPLFLKWATASCFVVNFIPALLFWRIRARHVCSDFSYRYMMAPKFS